MVHGPAPRLLSGHRAVPDRACGAGQVGKSAAPRGASSNLSHRAACHHAGRQSCPLVIPSTLQIIGAAAAYEVFPPASFRRREAPLVRNPLWGGPSGVNSSPGGTSAQQARTKPCPCREKRAHPKGQARQVKRTSAATRSPFGRYALSPSPAAVPAAAAALSAARFLWLRQPVQNTSAIPAAPPTVTPMRTLSTACRP